MKTEGMSVGEYLVSLEERIATLESERASVRSDGFVMPATPACETPQDRPRYADRSAVLKKLSAH